MRLYITGVVFVLVITVGVLMAMLPGRDKVMYCASVYEAGYLLGIKETTRMFKERMER